MSLDEISRKLDEIETEMKRIGYWETNPPAEAVARLADPASRSLLFYGVSFEQYLQLVFLPDARQRVKERNLPSESNLGLMGMRQYDYHSHVPEAQPLLGLLYAFDELVEARAK